MNKLITTIEALENCIGKTPPPMHLKVIDHLDEGALRWIGKSPLMFAAVGDGASIAITIGGGEIGFAGGDVGELWLEAASVDDPAIVRPGLGFGALFLLPGIGETLRVNGKVAEPDRDGRIRILVDECYGHCAKALIRSDFWAVEPIGRVPAGSTAFVFASRFLALATIDAQGRADLSPKGDPAGTMARIDDDRLWFAERPGNRRADSLRNIVDQPRMAGILLIPGSAWAVRLSGVARITSDELLRESFGVRNKTPLLVTGVEELEIELRESAALARACLWPVERPTEGIDPPRLFLDHIKRNKSFGAKMAGALLSVPGVPGLMRKGLEKDYKTNLY